MNYVWITAEKEMFHKYPKAPKEVAFLRNLHRHLFKFKIYIEVREDNREIEFFMFKKEIINILDKLVLSSVIKSCENMANYIAAYIFDRYPNRSIKIEISEDGENGVEMNYLWEKS